MKLINKIKGLFCNHDFRDYAGCDLEMKPSGQWVTVHRWKCRKCGKLQKHKKEREKDARK